MAKVAIEDKCPYDDDGWCDRDHKSCDNCPPEEDIAELKEKVMKVVRTSIAFNMPEEWLRGEGKEWIDNLLKLCARCK